MFILYILKFKRFNIDLRKAHSYVEGEFEDHICKGLENHKLFSDDLLYSFFAYENVKKVLKTGATRSPADNLIYTFNKKQLFIPGKRSNCTVRERLEEDLESAIAIYSETPHSKLLPAGKSVC